MIKNKNNAKIISMIILISILLLLGILICKKIYYRYEFSKVYGVLSSRLYDDSTTIQDYDEEINKVKNTLQKNKQNSELYLLSAMQEYKRGNKEKSKENLDLALENQNKKTYYRYKFYAHKYLFEIYVEYGNYEKAKLNFIEAIKSIPKINYNENYYEIGSLVRKTYGIEELENLATKMVEELILVKNIKPKTELYLREKIRTIYITNNQYAEATNSLIKSIDIAKEIDDKYSLANANISLAIVIDELGGYHSAVKLMEDALKIEIEDSYENAYIKTFGYLNLAYIQFYEFKNSQKSMNALNQIDKYIKNFSEEDFRDIEIYKLIYKANTYLLDNNLELANKSMNKAEALLKEDEMELYLYKELELKLVKARYAYKKGNYEVAFDLYKESVNECEKTNEKSKLRSILREVIYLYESIDLDDEMYEKYIDKLLKLGDEIQILRYQDYSHYISKSIKEQKKIKDNYNKYIKTARIGYIGVIGILVFYMYTDRKIKKLKYIGEYDGLTNVYNRKKFDTDYKYLLKRHKHFACIIMDIDNFKKINDTFGHGFGDIVLKNSSKKIKNIPPKEYSLYRYGGEEFIILGIYKNKDEVLELAESIRKSVEEMTWKEDIKVTMSIGVAFSDIDKDKVLESSDKNLYKAKHTGKNKVVY